MRAPSPARLARLIVLVLVAATAQVALVRPADAAGLAPTDLTLTGGRDYADQTVPVAIRLTSAGTPVAGAQVALERASGTGWTQVATLITDEDGSATVDLTLARSASENRLRAAYAGDPTYAASSASGSLALVRRAGFAVVKGPASVVDGREVTLRVGWATASGAPVRGVLRLERRKADGDWELAHRLRTGEDGIAHLTVTPRVDTRWRVRTPRLDWVEAATSPVLRIDNLPPGVPVRLPAAAPTPRISLPPQRRATGSGAHLVITPIPDTVWSAMTGVSWRRGCPVGRAGLRLIRVNYWGYDGYPHRGEVVAAAAVASRMGGALAEMYDRSLPIRSMYLVDRFGYSGRLRGGNDYASMAAGNTSAFNCRDVVNRPGVRSPHSTGRALDLNTWENPYRSATGIVPNRWWQSHSDPRVAWRSSSHPVVRLMARHGLRWTYGLGDTQHFDA